MPKKVWRDGSMGNDLEGEAVMTKKLIKNKDSMVMVLFGVIGITKRDNLTIDCDFHEINFTEDYDDLPMLIKIWLTTRNWDWIKDLAKKIGCATKIYYSNFVEYQDNDDSISALPLIIADEENAVVLAPRWIKSSIFDFPQQTKILEVNSE